MIVTIDGPAGAGKSHVSRALAARLGFRFLDTGAMYRAVALAGIRADVDWNDDAVVAALAGEVLIDFENDRVLLDGNDVTDQIRSIEVTSMIHLVADNPAAREHLVQRQREIAGQHDFVSEGRDQGTVAFPDAQCKIFLTASPEERARRRARDLELRGEQVTVDEVLTQQNERDRRDSSRPVGRLLKAEDAVEVTTDGMTPEEVVDELERIVRAMQA